MAGNAFEDSRVAAGTLGRRGQKPNGGVLPVEESKSLLRDDIRDGVARVLPASILIGDRVRNASGEELGKVEDIMLELPSGRIAYVILSFGSDELFAVPWSALRLDTEKHEFILNASPKTLENAPGFDKHNWPDMADPAFAEGVRRHYGEAAHEEQGAI